MRKATRLRFEAMRFEAMRLRRLRERAGNLPIIEGPKVESVCEEKGACLTRQSVFGGKPC
ncbi:MAG: hypothetical protein WBL39_24665 [Terrimicrobiaceae bacterium]